MCHATTRQQFWTKIHLWLLGCIISIIWHVSQPQWVGLPRTKSWTLMSHLMGCRGSEEGEVFVGMSQVFPPSPWLCWPRQSHCYLRAMAQIAGRDEGKEEALAWAFISLLVAGGDVASLAVKSVLTVGLGMGAEGRAKACKLGNKKRVGKMGEVATWRAWKDCAIGPEAIWYQSWSQFIIIVLLIRIGEFFKNMLFGNRWNLFCFSHFPGLVIVTCALSCLLLKKSYQKTWLNKINIKQPTINHQLFISSGASLKPPCNFFWNQTSSTAMFVYVSLTYKVRTEGREYYLHTGRVHFPLHPPVLLPQAVFFQPVPENKCLEWLGVRRGVFCPHPQSWLDYEVSWKITPTDS